MLQSLKKYWRLPFQVLLNPIKTMKKEHDWKWASIASMLSAFLVLLVTCPIYYYLNSEQFEPMGLGLQSLLMGAAVLFGLILPCIAFCLSLVVYTIGFSIGNNHKDGDYWCYLSRLLTVFSGYIVGVSVSNIILSPFPQLNLIVGVMMTAYLLFASICSYSTLVRVGFLRGVATHALIVFWTFVANALFT
ncbi:hypothetical protein [Vibrio harveyi]|uniref:hypothetical protein n=1 Tax=Vibrio harveyi TaxID=669 RepID=UPI003CEF86F1